MSTLRDRLDFFTPDMDLEHYLTEVWGHYCKRPGRIHPRTWDDGVMPLWEFSDEHVGRILDDVMRDSPPPRFFGEPGVFQMQSRSWHEWHWTRGRKLRVDPFYSTRSRRWIRPSLRQAVYDRDGRSCLHCGATEALSLDHIYPYSLGGEDTLENLQTLCRSCNSKKGAKV